MDKKQEFTAAHALAFIAEVAGQESGSVETAKAILLDESRSGESLVYTITDSLHETGRTIFQDWAEGLDQCIEDYISVLVKAGINPSQGVKTLEGENPARGQAVITAYDAFQPLAVAAGQSFILIGGGSDDYSFILVPTDVAERWTPVYVGQSNSIVLPHQPHDEFRLPPEIADK
jgi:hypothetical protein